MAETGTEEVLRVGLLEIVPAHHMARAGDEVLHLTRKEFALLVCLVRHEDQVCSRARLFELVWEQPLPDGDRGVDVYVRKLRVKLEQALPNWQFIHTHHGLGYRFSARARTRPGGLARGRGHTVPAADPARSRNKETL